MTPDIADRLLSYSAGPKAADRLMMDARSEIRVLRSEVTDLQNTIVRLTRELRNARDFIRDQGQRQSDDDEFSMMQHGYRGQD